MKVYIIAAIHNNQLCKLAFLNTEEMLIKQGYDVVNPLRLETCRQRISQLISCRAVYVNPNYKFNKMSTVEFDLAQQLGLVEIHSSAMNYTS